MACSCLPCFNNDDEDGETENPGPPPAVDRVPSKKETPAPLTETASPVPSHVKTFNFRELAMATKNFRQECLIGEGGFGRVFKGKLKSGETVAVKQLDRNGMQGSKEFEIVVAELCSLDHSNLLNLIGYCADGDQRLLIYEYMSMGSLDKHLFADDPDKTPMDWFTRMKVAAGAAQGLEYLHDTANPPIIFRDLKPSNILLDENYEVKLSDFGNDKLGAGGGNMHPTSRVMGTYGYSAPEYSSGGDLTLKSDIYSFGVVLLELITGKKVMDTNRPNDEQNLVTWAQPIFRDPKRFPDLADPRLDKLFPVKGLNQAVGICAMCLQEEADVRPLVTDLVAALSFLSMPQPIPPPAPEPLSPPPQQKMESPKEADNTDEGEEDEGEEDEEEEEDDDYSSEEDGSGSNADSADLTEDDGEHGNTSDVNVLQSDQNSSKKIVSTEDIITQDGDENGNTRNVNLLQSNQNSSKKQRIASSSRNGSKRRSTSTKRTGSTRRKVTFKEPNPSTKKNVSKKHEPAKDLEVNQKGSNSGSENSDDEKRSSRRKESIEDDQ